LIEATRIWAEADLTVAGFHLLINRSYCNAPKVNLPLNHNYTILRIDCVMKNHARQLYAIRLCDLISWVDVVFLYVVPKTCFFCLYRGGGIIAVDEILHKAKQKTTYQALQSYFSTYITVEWSSTVESRLTIQLMSSTTR
jgi:hypothetical protein